MATSIGQYAPVFLPGEPPWQRCLQVIVYRVTKSLTWLKRHYVQRCKTLLSVAALPQWGLSIKLGQLFDLQLPWWCQVCRDTDRLHHKSYGTIRIFSWAYCIWWSEGLFGQSFSVAMTIQALRELSCVGSFFIVQQVRHIVGPSWLGSYSKDQHFRHLKGHPGWRPTL